MTNQQRIYGVETKKMEDFIDITFKGVVCICTHHLWISDSMTHLLGCASNTSRDLKIKIKKGLNMWKISQIQTGARWMSVKIKC